MALIRLVPLFVLLMSGHVGGAHAQTEASPQAVPIINGQIEGVTGSLPDGWIVTPGNGLGLGYEIGVTTDGPHSGATAARLSWPGEESAPANGFASLAQTIDAAPLHGKRIRYRAAARNGGSGPGHVGLWMRIDGETRTSSLFFDNMNARPITSEDWAVYEISANVPLAAKTVYIGFLVSDDADAFFDSVELEVVGDIPPPSAEERVGAWLRTVAQPLAGTEIGTPRTDLEAFSAMVGDARIVSLGEATHGSREHFQLKGRLIEHLVESEGFTAFGIEASYADTMAVNTYVLTGEGDLNSVVRGMIFWTWSTEEVAELVQWLRDYNLRVPAERQVRFYGFDAQALSSPLRVAAAYLERAGRPLPGADGERLKALVDEPMTFWRGMGRPAPAEQRERLSWAATALSAHFDAEREALIAATSAADFTAYRQAATAFDQAVRIEAAGIESGSWTVRDRFMADNVDWILEQADRVVLWAHNGHINEGMARNGLSMGGELNRRHGDDHISVGFFFGSGGFQAVGPSAGRESSRLRPFAVGPLSEDTLDHVLSRAELSNYYFDVRSAEADPQIREWFSESRPTRWYGALYDPAWGAGANLNMRLPSEFDIAVFTLTTTPARPLPPAPVSPP